MKILWHRKNSFIYSAWKKNKEGLDADSILSILDEDTVVVHDHNMVNYNNDYEFQNAECCIHLIRNLEKIKEDLNRKWAEELIVLLKETNKKRKE